MTTLSETADDLWEALKSGLILPLDEAWSLVRHGGSVNATYRFLHDRVQQAAYTMLPVEKRGALHLQIGRILLQILSRYLRDGRGKVKLFCALGTPMDYRGVDCFFEKILRKHYL